MEYHKLKPTAFHYGVRAFYGKQAQIDKVIEELKELQDAIDEGDVRHIIEECADVEITIPYIEVVYQLGSLPTLKWIGVSFDYKEVSNILIALLEIRSKSGKGKLDTAIRVMVEHVAYSLYTLYKKYSITREDIEEMKNEKYRRTIIRTVNKITGG